MIEHLLRIIDGYACGEEDTKRRQEIQAEYDKAVAAAVAAAAVQTQSPAVEQAALEAAGESGAASKAESSPNDIEEIQDRPRRQSGTGC